MRSTFVFFFLFYWLPYNVLSQAEIVGGDNADIEDYPYQAALLYNSGGWSYAYCGASIINEYWILTAAHCVEGESASTTVVRVGSDNSYAQGGTTYTADEIIMHNNYNSNTMNNDIALIKLDNPISFNNYKQPVFVMCDEQVDLGVQDPGEMSWVTGWGDSEGTTNSSQLQVVGVPITTQSNYGWGQIDSDMIMAGYSSGGYDSCQGDSGGPMVVLAADGETYLQCGIVSWGSGCADAGYPGVYTRVSYFINWICDNTDGDVCANESDFCTGNAIYGCTDLTAENYNSEATVDDSSCEYACDETVTLVITFDCWPEETGWSIINENGSVIASQNAGYYSSSATSEDICLSEGCYTFTITDSYGDGLGGSQWSGCSTDGSYDVSADSDVFISGGGDFGSSSIHEFCVTTIIYGCSDVTACNYNPAATDDDGSCTYIEENYDCDGNCIVNVDCNGDCGGTEIVDECGNCGGDGISEAACDCVGNVDLGCGCGNPAAVDGYDCDGNCILDVDCNGDCGGDTVLDECGDCGGDGISEGTCDCYGNIDLGCGCGNPEAVDGYDCDGNPILLTQYIQFETGWNMWSTYIEETGSMSSIFEEIEENVIIVKDQNGNVYWPEYGLNSIGNLTIGAGYQIKMSDYSYLALSGSVIPYDEEMSLDLGWSIIGYLHQDFGDIVQFFEPYADAVVIIKDEDGNVYWPEYELNSIGNMSPGEGYQIKTSTNFTFSYQDLVDERLSFTEEVNNIYFGQSQITGNNMTILFPFETTNSLLSENNEIAAYNQSGLLVGSTVVSNGHTVITIWGDDITTLEKDGISEGEEIAFRLWNFQTGVEKILDVRWEEGVGVYTTDGISIVGEIINGSEIIPQRQLVKITDVLGREVNRYEKDIPLLYIYDDGSIERKFINE